MIHDVAIVGAGIFGRTLAQRLACEGKSIILFDAGEIGGEAQNASAGLLGALMPPSPLMTGPLAVVQLRCLSRYQNHIDELALPTGYKRAGRLQPILTEQALAQFTQQQAACAQSWHDHPANDHLRVITHTELAEQFPDFALQLADAPYGYAIDQVSAQVAPRLLLAALVEDIKDKVTLQPHARVLRIDGGHIITTAATFQAKQIIVTAGWQTGALAPQAPIVGVKGQACAVAPVITNAPLLYTRNGYIVFHDGCTALGSTTEKHWTDTEPNSETCEAIKQRAAALMPVLAEQPIIECWAEVRPKASGALPFVSRINDTTIVASGGYKVGLALGFELAGWLTSAIEQNATHDFWNFVNAKENLALPDMLNMTAA